MQMSAYACKIKFVKFYKLHVSLTHTPDISMYLGGRVRRALDHFSNLNISFSSHEFNAKFVM